jgi:phasin
MPDQSFNDFVPPEMRKFAEQSVQQAKKAFDELMTATQRAVSTFEGHASSAQTAAIELQRKVVSYSERNVGASLEFAQKLLQAKAPEDVMKLHADYVKAQIQALTELARDIAQHAAKAAKPAGKDS